MDNYRQALVSKSWMKRPIEQEIEEYWQRSPQKVEDNLHIHMHYPMEFHCA